MTNISDLEKILEIKETSDINNVNLLLSDGNKWKLIGITEIYEKKPTGKKIAIKTDASHNRTEYEVPYTETKKPLYILGRIE